jgi:DNA-binding transcriptional ArsR family regulator
MPDPLSTTFSALADPTRRAILARLTAGEASVTELARPFDMSLPSICKHLKVLEAAGLIARRCDGQWRPRRLEVAPLHQVADWVQYYRQFWEHDFNRPHELPALNQGQEKHRHKQVHK